MNNNRHSVMTKRGILCVTMLLILTLMASSCVQTPPPEPEPPPEPAPDTTEPIQELEPEPEPDPLPAYAPPPERENPLTGLEMDPEKLTSRPAAVMINNIRISLPQSGICAADIIFEFPVEGGITRMMALFKDPSVVGPLGTVRSSRKCFVQTAQGFDAIYMHVGASEEAYSYIAANKVTALDGIRGGWEGSLYYRDQERIKTKGLEHSAYTDGERMENAIKTLSERGSRVEIEGESQKFFEFAAEEFTPDGKSANNADIAITSLVTAGFDYNDSEGVYYKTQLGGPHFDEAANKQLSSKNVVVLAASVKLKPGDPYGLLDIGIIGSGDGYYLTNGKYTEIKWSKAGAAEPIVLTDKNGAPLIMNRGNMYICVVSSLERVTVDESQGDT